MPTPPRIVLLRRHHAAHQGAGAHALRHHSARRDGRAIAYRDVLDGADLPGDHAAAPDLRAARKARLRRDHRVFAKLRVVAHLNEIVELDAAPQHRVCKAAAIDRAVRADLAIVFDAHATELQELHLPALFIRHETEAVCPDDRTGMDTDALADLRALIDRYVRIEHTVIANVTFITNDHAGVQGDAVADAAVLADGDTRMNR